MVKRRTVRHFSKRRRKSAGGDILHYKNKCPVCPNARMRRQKELFMATRERIYERFIEPFRKPCGEEVGIEAEFPLRMLNGAKPDRDEILAAFAQTEKAGYLPDKTSLDGNVISRSGADGTNLSFDTSYLNFEFSMHPTATLTQTVQDFYKAFALADGAFRSRGLAISGSALNKTALEYGDSMRIRREADEVHELEYRYLSAPERGVHPVFAAHPNFFTLISSLQMHLDTDLDRLPLVLNTLAKLDFIDLLLFANSPCRLGGLDWLDGRYYFYLHSAFTPLGLTGTPDTEYRSIEQIVDDYAQREYPCGDENIFSYHNAELSTFGTVEYRVTDTQPLGQELLPALFVYGLMKQPERAYEILSRIHGELYPQHTNSELCILAARADCVRMFETPAMRRALTELYELAVAGVSPDLRSRMLPLGDRIERLSSPAKELLAREARARSSFSLLQSPAAAACFG